MKKAVGLIMVIAFAAIGFAVYTDAYESYAEPEKKSPPAPEAWRCPVSQISDNDKCMSCHKMIVVDGKPKFGLKEIPIEAAYDDKPHNLIIVRDGDGIAGQVSITGVGYGLRSVANYLYRHPEINKLILDIHSPGGSVMGAWKTVGIIKEMQSRGIVVATRCYGLAASAGGILLIAGNVGERTVAPNTEIMMHKVWQFQLFSVDDPDTAEDKAALLKHFQDNINGFFVERTRMTQKQIDQCLYKKDFWFTGKDAVDIYGVADNMVGR